MKILLINQTFFPDLVATAQHATDIAQFLKAEGHDVSVTTDVRSYSDRKKKHPKKEVLGGIFIHRVNSSGFGKRNLLTRIIDAVSFELSLLWKLLTLPRYDVVICFTSPPLIGVLAVLYCRIKSSYLVQWLMDINPETAVAVGYFKKNSPTVKLLQKLFHFSVNQTDHFVVLDRWMQKKLLDEGASEKNISIVPPWPLEKIDTDGGVVKENYFRRKLNLQDKFVVLYSGNHSIAHPLDTLLKAAVALKEDPKIVFVFVGAGIRVADVSEYVQEHRLRNVIQLPYQPRHLLKESLSLADLHTVVMGASLSGLVHSSKIYGILSSGKPYIFVGPKNSHVTDLLGVCKTGYQVDHGEVDQFIQYIELARNLSHSALNRIQTQSIGYVQTHCTLEKLISPFIKNLERLEVGPLSKPSLARV